jgi:hypothetical protein
MADDRLIIGTGYYRRDHASPVSTPIVPHNTGVPEDLSILDVEMEP